MPPQNKDTVKMNEEFTQKSLKAKIPNPKYHHRPPLTFESEINYSDANDNDIY